MKTEREIKIEIKDQELLAEKLNKELCNMSQMASIEYGDKVQNRMNIANGKVEALKWMLS